ncbi:MAG: hypothetical protein MUE33_02720 [Cytophagaceae bacterium]|jgi:hypothetical protein|nr:hypothetical protein [Cytophagaceae bacterium]
MGDSYLFWSNTIQLSNIIGYDIKDYYAFLTNDFMTLPLPKDVYATVVIEPRVLSFMKIFYLLAASSFFSPILLAFTILVISSWIVLLVSESSLIKDKASFLIAFVVLPTFTFQTSGFSKEALILPLLLWMFSFIVQFNFRKGQYIGLLLFLLLLYWVIQVKYYYAFVFILITVIYWFLIKVRLSKWYITIGVLFGIGLTVLLAPLLHPYLSLQLLPELVHVNYTLFCPDTNYPSCIELPIDGTWYSILWSLPKAIVYGLFAPLPGMAHHTLAFFVSLEHCIVGMLFLIALFHLSQNRFKEYEKIIFFCLLTFVLGLIAMSAPNVGSLLRYKQIVWPIIVMGILQEAIPLKWKESIVSFWNTL